MAIRELPEEVSKVSKVETPKTKKAISGQHSTLSLKQPILSSFVFS
jgi:hypothetical protein